MSHGSRFVKLLTLVALLAGLVGCGAAVDAPTLGASDRLVLPNRASPLRPPQRWRPPKPRHRQLRPPQ